MVCRAQGAIIQCCTVQDLLSLRGKQEEEIAMKVYDLISWYVSNMACFRKVRIKQ